MGSYPPLANLAPVGSGSAPLPAESEPASKAATSFAGRILAPLCDDAGDFDGFVLETARGTERCFETRDPTIAAVIQRAWYERRSISVTVMPGHPRRPVSVTLDPGPSDEQT